MSSHHTVRSLFLQTVFSQLDHIAIAGTPTRPQVTNRGLLSACLALLGGMPLAKGPSFVAVCACNGHDTVLGAVTALLMGATYFALHPSDPEPRMKQMLDQTQPVVVFCSQQKAASFPKGSWVVVTLCDDIFQQTTPLRGLSEDVNPSLFAQSLNDDRESIVFCTFTSGSTGHPKGVLLSHRAILAFLDGIVASDGGTRRATVLQMSRTTFDIHYFECVGILCLGGTTVPLPSTLYYDPIVILNTIQRNEVSWLFCVPSMAQLLMDIGQRSQFASLRSVFIGGEIVSVNLLRAFAGATTTCMLYQAYGPSECAIFTTIFLFASSDGQQWSPGPHQKKVPLGRALPGYNIIVQNGTLHVSGPCLFSGYLHDGSSSTLDSYDTGDVVHVLPNDEIEFVGRNDTQVKIRGQRVDLGEIEHVLNSHPSVKFTVCVKERKTGVLVAYVGVIASDEKTLHQHVADQLPLHMVPARIQIVKSALPTLPNGKVDRALLSLPTLRVAIIGGGVGGILAALTCQRRGVSFTIFEESDTLGGVWVNGTASLHSRLQQPGEYYQLEPEISLPNRYPGTSELRSYLSSVCARYDLSSYARLKSRVVSVRCNADEVQVNNEPFGAVIVATGRFHKSNALLPISFGISACDVCPHDLRDRDVVIVGGGPYAIETVREAVLASASSVTLYARRLHWVFPRKWFVSRALTNLYWRLFGGVGISKKLKIISAVILYRHYARSGIVHFFPFRVPFTDHKTTVSDEFFEFGTSPNVKYVLGEITKETTPVCGNVVLVLACGFTPPTFPFLEHIKLSENVYKGCTLHSDPRICFLGLGLGAGVFSNPHTMRLQADVIVNQLLYPNECLPSVAAREAWLGMNSDIGWNVHTAEHLYELQWQRQQRGKRCSDVLLPPSELSEASILQVLHVCGVLTEYRTVSSASAVPLVQAGFDSVQIMRFRALVSTRWPTLRLPSVATMLWDLPTLKDVARCLLLQQPQQNTDTTAVAEATDNAQLLSEEDAYTYIAEQLSLPHLASNDSRTSDPIGFISKVLQRFQQVVAFQSLTIILEPSERRIFPTLLDIKRFVYAKIGGCCYVLNVFIRELLRALNFDTYYARCAIHGVEDCHMAVVVRNIRSDGSLHLVDVGCGYIMPQPLALNNFEGDESPEYQHGFLRVKFVRNGQHVLRLHHRDSTLELSELTLNRPDGFDHVFWSMSLKPRPLHDHGETQQRRAFNGFQKIRAAIGRTDECRMIYFKADNKYGKLHARIMEDVDGTLHATHIQSKEELVTRLREAFPMFTKSDIQKSMEALGTLS